MLPFIPSRRSIAAALAAAATFATPASAQILDLPAILNQLLDLDVRVTLQTGRITVLENGAVTTTQALTLLQTTTQNLTTTVANQAVQLNDNSVAINVLTNRSNQNDAAIAALQAADITANAGIAANANALLSLDDRIAAAEATLTAHGSALAAVDVRLGANDATNTGQDGRITALEGRTGTLEVDTAALDGRVGTAEVTLGNHEGRIGALETGVATGTGGTGGGGDTTTIVNLTNRTDTIETNVTNNTTAISVLDGRVDTVETDVAALDVRVGGVETDVAALDTRVTATDAAVAVERGRNDAQDVRLADHDTRITNATTIAVAARDDSAALRGDITAGRIGLVQVAPDSTITVGAEVGGTTVSVAGQSGNRRITGVADGVAPSDVATTGQVTAASAATLSAANAYTDRAVGEIVDRSAAVTQQLISRSSDVLRREMNGIAANGAALSGLPQATIPGKGFAGMAIGGHGGSTAVALGLSKAFEGDHAPVLRAGAAVDTRRGDVTFNAGAGIHF